MEIEIVTRQKLQIPEPPRLARFDDGSTKTLGQLTDDQLKKFCKAYTQAVMAEAKRQRDTK